MNDMERLNDALKGLRDDSVGRGASGHLETRLRAAFREKHAPRRRFHWSWLGALATAALALFIMWRLSTPEQVQAPPAIADRTPAPQVTPAPQAPEVVASAAPKKKPATLRKRPAPARQQAVDAVTAAARDSGFIALPYAPPMFPNDRGQVMRVRMPLQTLRRLGMPMNEERIMERIPADVLLGEDGIPRAVRIVNSR